MKEFDFIIIGGGLAGLAAHHQLHKKGYSVLQLEKNDQVGGRTRTLDINGSKADVGTQFFHQDYRRIMRLVDEFKLEYQATGSTLEFMTAKKSFMLNSKNPFSAWMSGMLGLKENVRFISEVMKYRKHHPEDMLDGLEFDDIDARALSLDKLSPQLYAQIILPYFSAFTYASGEELSGAMLIRALKYMGTRNQSIGLKGGLATLPQALAKNKYIKTSITVENLDGNSVITNQGDFKAKKILIATTASEAQRLLKEKFPSSLKTDYSPSLHYAVLTRQIPGATACYATLVNESRNSQFNVVTRERLKAPELVTANHELYGLLASKKGANQKASVDLSLMNILEKDVLETRETIWKEAIPLFPPGKLKAIMSYRQSLRAEQEVFLAGDYLGSQCAEGAVESGEVIAALFP